MTSTLTQIKTAYELENMTPEQIAEDQTLDVAAVKGALMSVSAKYRKDCGKEDSEKDDLNYSDDQLRDVTQAIYELAMSTEDEHLKFKALTYVRDDKKGRKDVVKQQQGNQFNLFQFNQQILQAREAVAGIKRKLVEI